MGKSSPAAPAAPDPSAESAAQTQSNQETALYNFGLNNPNTTTPLGSLQFNTDTSNPNEPTTTENVTLSPAEQAIFDQNNQNIQQQGSVANTALQGVQNQANQPYNLQGNIPQTLSGGNQQQDLQNAENSLYSQQTQYLDPQFQQGQAQLQSQLADQGIPQGSSAYNTAMQNFGLQKQQAYQSAMNQATSGGAAYQAQLNQTGLANQAQQAQLYTQQYNQPLSFYSSLMSGTQPTLPQFSGVNQSSAAPTNVLGAYQNAYQGNLNSYNAQVGSANSATSGLTGLLGTGSLAAATAFSDSRLKKNIKRIGEMKNGLPVYQFSYLWDTIKHIGVMAQDVLHVKPEAVIIGKDGFMMVDYSMIGE